jgi:hypothetical protein
MTQEEALDQVEEILRSVTGKRLMNSDPYWRGVKIGKDLALTVDVLSGKGCDGHFRVHVWRMEPDDPAVQVRNGSPSIPPAIGKCSKCNLSPAQNPAFYRGEGGRGYFGFQWHSRVQPNADDLDQVRQAVSWLWQRFGR